VLPGSPEIDLKASTTTKKERKIVVSELSVDYCCFSSKKILPFGNQKRKSRKQKRHWTNFKK
jgi:hypothetical protein